MVTAISRRVRASARASALLPKRARSCSVRCVTGSSFRPRCGCSAACGVSHISSTASPRSASACWPGGAATAKKRVSKRLGTPGGVSQWLK